MKFYFRKSLKTITFYFESLLYYIDFLDSVLRIRISEPFFEYFLNTLCQKALSIKNILFYKTIFSAKDFLSILLFPVSLLLVTTIHFVSVLKCLPSALFAQLKYCELGYFFVKI